MKKILKANERRLAQLSLDLAGEFILWTDATGHLIHGNTAVCHALGFSADELRSLRVWDVSPRTAASWPARFAEMKLRLSDTFVAELHGRSGEIIPVQASVRFASIEENEYLICCARDLRQHRATPQNQVAESPFPSLLESTVDAIFIIHEERLVHSSRGSSEHIRRDLESMLSEFGTIRKRIERALEGEVVTFNWYSPRPDGSLAHLECSLSRIEIEGHVRVLAVAVDITAKRRSERALAQLSGRLIALQDTERRRLARDLHDTAGQNLSALTMRLSATLTGAPDLDPQVAAGIREGIALSEACIRDLRTMSYVLHPPLLDELGLESAIRAYSEGYAERTAIKLDLDLPPQIERLPQDVETTLFRILQEALSNIHRHSGSETALIRLRQRQAEVELEIVDHGKGVPPGTLENDVSSAFRIGVGIAGMRERARQLGGRLTIASGETGTTLHVVLPAVAG